VRRANRAVAEVAAGKFSGSIRPLARRWVVEWPQPGGPFRIAFPRRRPADLRNDRTARLPRKVQLTELELISTGRGSTGEWRPERSGKTLEKGPSCGAR
jgi:hypothetical protein